MSSYVAHDLIYAAVGGYSDAIQLCCKPPTGEACCLLGGVSLTIDAGLLLQLHDHPTTYAHGTLTSEVPTIASVIRMVGCM